MPYRLISANVLTVRPADEASGIFSTRRRQLEFSFTAAQGAIIGLQKALSRAASIRLGRHFWMVASAAEAGGHYGNELWIDSGLVDGESAFFMLCSEPRRLVVQVRSTLGDLTVACSGPAGNGGRRCGLVGWHGALSRCCGPGRATAVPYRWQLPARLGSLPGRWGS